ncbi:hypothetical protein OQA88_8235 [Cercophora sp. LCS_1]
MRLTSALVSCLVLALGVASAPVDGTPSAPACEIPAEDRFPVATFTSWITECGEGGGYTKGITMAYRKYNDLCRPLPDDIRGLEISEVDPGCRVMVFRSPVCNDYPYDGAYREKPGCLWAGNQEFRSFKVTCST